MENWFCDFLPNIQLLRLFSLASRLLAAIEIFENLLGQFAQTTEAG
jgi:hypothetical protein